MKKLFLNLKNLWLEVENDIAGTETILNEVKTANLGVTDPAEWVTNAANAIVKNASSLPTSWQGANLEKSIIKYLSKLENGVTAADIESIVKNAIASNAVK